MKLALLTEKLHERLTQKVRTNVLNIHKLSQENVLMIERLIKYVITVCLTVYTKPSKTKSIVKHLTHLFRNSTNLDHNTYGVLKNTEHKSEIALCFVKRCRKFFFTEIGSLGTY